jgi:uncharacterized pyridoxamine 5'-phosphate oxidase family protein
MDFSECVTFANENPIAYIATADGDQPRVRAFSMWFADETGFYFHTGTAKRVYRQLAKNPKVELCFYAPGEAAGKMMRVTGTAEFLSDAALEQRLMRDRPWLAGLMKSAPEGSNLAMFRIGRGEAYFWTMADNMREDLAPRAKF